MTDPLPSEVQAASAGSAFDLSLPSRAYGTRQLWGGNYIVARVNGVKTILTSQEYQQHIDNGDDVVVFPLGQNGEG